MSVYVIAEDERPLMPCSEAKARHLLDAKRAKVKHRTPFTIQMIVPTTHYTQKVILGVDAGSKAIGISCRTKEKELFAEEVKLRNDVVDNLSTRRKFRRARRNRKTRYRKPRFYNRVRSKQKGWLAPSVEVKIQEHVTEIKRICNLLPVTKVVVETAEFDLQFIKAVEEGKPVPQGEDYQKGDMLGQYNVRQYVLWRDGYTCQCCGAHATKKNDIKLHVHHRESRKTGGNAPNNLVTLCEDCHEKLHKGIIIADDLKKRERHSMRDATFMGIMRKEMFRRLRSELDIPVWETHGYVTKYTREEKMHMPKSHINDALAICHGPAGFNDAGECAVVRANRTYTVKPVRHHNRQLHKATILKGGVRKTNQTEKYIKGFRLFDKVLFEGKECYIWGRRTSGYFLLKNINGERIKDGVGYKHLTLLERGRNYLIS